MFDNTIKFKLNADREKEMREILLMVYGALVEKGYDPVNQIVGYLLSEDPTYITNYKNARALIRMIDRDELLQELVRNYLQE
ncbi:MAG: IreB family regulatory phosphoprotein [Clostridiales bacterium]|nr:IreB family regulatory phosphoprotein [Clostridiales bacterium]